MDQILESAALCLEMVWAQIHALKPHHFGKMLHSAINGGRLRNYKPESGAMGLTMASESNVVKGRLASISQSKKARRRRTVICIGRRAPKPHTQAQTESRHNKATWQYAFYTGAKGAKVAMKPQKNAYGTFKGFSMDGVERRSDIEKVDTTCCRSNPNLLSPAILPANGRNVEPIHPVAAISAERKWYGEASFVRATGIQACQKSGRIRHR